MGRSQETGQRLPWNNSGRDSVVARTKRDREGMGGSRNTGDRRIPSPGAQQRVAELLLCWFREIPTELSLTDDHVVPCVALGGGGVPLRAPST